MRNPTRCVTMELDTSTTHWRVRSKKFNPMWLWNPFSFLLCVVGALLIPYFAYKYGGVPAFIVSLYSSLGLGRLSTLFIFDVEHKFWDIKYEVDTDAGKQIV